MQGVVGCVGCGVPPYWARGCAGGGPLRRVRGVRGPLQGARGAGAACPVPPPPELPAGAHAGHAAIQAGPLRGRRRFPPRNKRNLSSPRVKPRGGADPYHRGPGDHKHGAAGRHPPRGATGMPLGNAGAPRTSLAREQEGRPWPRCSSPGKGKGGSCPLRWARVPGWGGLSSSAKHRGALGLW